MIYNKALKYQNDIICVPFQKEYWNEYMKIYNECFYKMRKALEVEPINFYYDYSQIKDKINDIFLYLQNGVIVGAVSCYENELDDLIVEKSFQGQGIGQKLLFWGMNHINVNFQNKFSLENQYQEKGAQSIEKWAFLRKNICKIQIKMAK